MHTYLLIYKSYNYKYNNNNSALAIHLLLLHAIKFDHFRFCAWGM